MILPLEEVDFEVVISKLCGRWKDRNKGCSKIKVANWIKRDFKLTPQQSLEILDTLIDLGIVKSWRSFSIMMCELNYPPQRINDGCT